jgi:hypothetical protein
MITAIYYVQRNRFNIRRTTTYLNDLFWDINNALEICNGFEDEDPDLIANTVTVTVTDDPLPAKVEVKYEDKYLNELEKLNPNFQYTWDMIRQRDEKMIEIVEGIRIKIENEIKILTHRLTSSDDEEERTEVLERIKTLKNELESPNEEEIKQEAQLCIKNNYLDGLINNFIMEKTPSGNVIMYYNNKRGSFEFYSDNTIPYRYLETVSRKYVKTFNCRYLYVDMENELSEFDRLKKVFSNRERKRFTRYE